MQKTPANNKKNRFHTEIIVNVHPLEKRVAVLEDSRLVELFVERKDKQNIVGNIYKGHVKDVLPGMGAAFIKSIRGSYANVSGLPVCEVLEELKKLDAVHFGGNRR